MDGRRKRPHKILTAEDPVIDGEPHEPTSSFLTDMTPMLRSAVLRCAVLTRCDALRCVSARDFFRVAHHSRVSASNFVREASKREGGSGVYCVWKVAGVLSGFFYQGAGSVVWFFCDWTVAGV